MQASPEFQELRSRFRSFVFPMTIAFLVWYFLYVLLSIYATSFMGTKAFGNITWGLPHHLPVHPVRQSADRPPRGSHPPRAGR